MIGNMIGIPLGNGSNGSNKSKEKREVGPQERDRKRDRRGDGEIQIQEDIQTLSRVCKDQGLSREETERVIGKYREMRIRRGAYMPFDCGGFPPMMVMDPEGGMVEVLGEVRFK